MSNGPFREMTAEQIAKMSAKNRASRTHRLGDTVQESRQIEQLKATGKKIAESVFKATSRQSSAISKAKATGRKRPPTPTEHAEQSALIFWWDAVAAQHGLDHRLLFAIPNGGDRHPAVAAKLKVEGVRAGVPDLMLAVARMGTKGWRPYGGLFIELKRVGIKSAKAGQEEYHALLRAQGYRVEVCSGFEAARAAILGYLGIEA